MPSLTIAAAARHCGVDRRTLQRAIKAGRLPLTPDHHLTLEALALAGDAPATPPQGHVPGALPQFSQVLAQLERIEAHLARQVAQLDALCALLTPQGQAAAAPHPSQRRTPAALQPSPQVLGIYDPQGAVLRIQALRHDGLSYDRIAAVLQAEGIPTRYGQPWQGSSVRYLLQQAGREA
jgi:hypothetical protein